MINIGSHDTEKLGSDAGVMATIMSEQAPPVAAQRQGSSVRGRAGKSVLIIEDEALIAMGFESSLRMPALSK